MKIYGAKKATEFNKGHIGRIYRLAKEDKIELEKWVANDFYNLADYYGFDDNRSVARDERKILAIIKEVEEENIEKAQELINDYTESKFELLSRKNQQRANRNLVA